MNRNSIRTGVALTIFSFFAAIACNDVPENRNSITTADSVAKSDSVIVSPPFDTTSQVALEIHSMFEDREGNIWFGLNSFGACKYNPNAAPGSDSVFTYFTEKDGLISNHVGMITQDDQGSIWFNTAYGVCRYKDKKFTSFTDKDKQPIFPKGEQIARSQTNYFWLGTNSGAYRCNGYELEYYRMPLKSGDPFVKGIYPSSPSGYTVYATLTDQRGDYWFATTSAGIGHYNGVKFEYLQTGLIDGVPRCMYEDRSGKIWVGTNGGGVSYFDGKQWVNFCAERGFGNDHSTSNMDDPLRKLNRVWSITEDHAGNMWFGTLEEGVWKYDPIAHSMTNYAIKDGLTSSSVWVVYTDRSGKVWAGTDGGGVCTFDGTKFKNFTTAN